ncbi:WbqC family protein [Patescibacteria group bacterium]|nr:WbqC family protein [Patescibacteria group bacterium]
MRNTSSRGVLPSQDKILSDTLRDEVFSPASSTSSRRTRIIKNKRYTGIQPQYFPRLHYFARILNTDIFMIRDDAQYVRKHKYPDGKVDKSYQAHTPIKQSFGRQLLAVPTKHVGFSPLTKTHVSYDHNWPEVHLKTIRIAYGRSRNFVELHSEISNILNRKHKNIVELNLTTIFWGILRILGEQDISEDKLTIKFVNEKLKDHPEFRLTSIQLASEVNVIKDHHTPNEKIVALCKSVGANEDYCGGTGAAAYMDEGVFKKHGIKITIQDWNCRKYSQLFEKQQDFIPNLSMIDLLMNVSLQKAQEIIKG